MLFLNKLMQSCNFLACWNSWFHWLTFYFVVEFFHILVHFMYRISINYLVWGIEIQDYNWGFVIFSSHWINAFIINIPIFFAGKFLYSCLLYLIVSLLKNFIPSLKVAVPLYYILSLTFFSLSFYFVAISNLQDICKMLWPERLSVGTERRQQEIGKANTRDRYV